jgi:hypothetical protein
MRKNKIMAELIECNRTISSHTTSIASTSKRREVMLNRQSNSKGVCKICSSSQKLKEYAEGSGVETGRIPHDTLARLGMAQWFE